MANNRPNELNEYIEKSSEKNDQSIADALEKIETQAKPTIKPTVSSVCKLTNLARNTVRNRQWAIDRLKSIKQKMKSNVNEKSGINPEDISKTSAIDHLRHRIKSLLDQNILLYQEVITLQQRVKILTLTIQKKDQEINLLKNG